MRAAAKSYAAALTILLSWALIHTILALHYAHEFYAEHRNSGQGLEFPGGEPPNYWDFIYFSFVIGMTSQVSDVPVTSRTIRKTVIAHSVVSFIFNVTLLALSFNIVASALSQPCMQSTESSPVPTVRPLYYTESKAARTPPTFAGWS